MARHRAWGASLTPQEQALFLRLTCKLIGAPDLQELAHAEALRQSLHNRYHPYASRTSIPPPHNLPQHRRTELPQDADVSDAARPVSPQASLHARFLHDPEELDVPLQAGSSWNNPIALDETYAVLSSSSSFSNGTRPPVSLHTRPHGTRRHHEEDWGRRHGITPMSSYGLACKGTRRDDVKASMSPHSASSSKEQVSNWAHGRASISPYRVFSIDEQEPSRIDGETSMSSHGICSSRWLSNNEEQDNGRVYGKAPINAHMVASSEEQETGIDRKPSTSRHPVFCCQSVSSTPKDQEMRRAHGKSSLGPHVSSSEEQDNTTFGKAPLSPRISINEKQERRIRIRVLMGPREMCVSYIRSNPEEQDKRGEPRKAPMIAHRLSSSEEQENKRAHDKATTSLHKIYGSEVQKRRSSHEKASNILHGVSNIEEEEDPLGNLVPHRRKRQREESIEDIIDKYRSCEYSENE